MNMNKTEKNTTDSCSGYTFPVGCPYALRCNDYGIKCGSCANNPNKSYYIPESYYPTTPYTPWSPWTQPCWGEPWVTCVCGGSA